MLNLNPFLYGKPVPPKRFVGRRDAVRTVFSRLYNGESTAVVGEPHIGKSSLLRYIADDGIRREWLRESADRLFFVEMDCHLMPQSFNPADFWCQVLSEMPPAIGDESVARQWQRVVDGQFGSFALESLFRLLARIEWRVALVIDEFDSLLNHPNFDGQFFGALRSLAIRSDGLAVITASRLPVAVMNRRHQELNPYGSPFFNNLAEVRLQPLSPDECRVLVELTLAGTGAAFDEDDLAFISSLTGRHPFLVQMAAAALFDAVVEGKTGEACYQSASAAFYDRAAAHFDDFWQHLSPVEQTAMVVLALGELKGCVDRREFDTGEFGPMEWYGPQLADLEKMGVVERVDPNSAISSSTRWGGASWRVASRGFVRWVSDNVVVQTRQTVRAEQWLQDSETRGLFSREQANKVRDLIGAIPASVSEHLGADRRPEPGGTPAARPRERTGVFISYSHKDKKWLDELHTMLKPLVRSGAIAVWDDTQLKAGEKWREEIADALSSARVAVLLVSPDFLASDFIATHELPPLLEAAERDGLTILWLAVRPSLYKHVDLEKYQAANDPARPLSRLSPGQRDEELVRISEQIAGAADPVGVF